MALVVIEPRNVYAADRAHRCSTRLRKTGVIASATAEDIAAGTQAAAAAEFLDVVKADAARARAAFRLVLAQPSIGSQMVDNLNATTHVRTLLTDLFLLDETIKISGL